MTQQRDAKKDLEFLDKSCVTAVFSISEYWIKESEKMKARTNQLASESSKQFVAMTNALMRAEAAEQELEAQRIRADKAEQEVRRIREESTIWECRALAAEQSIGMFDKLFHETHADLVVTEQERDKLVVLLDKIETGLEYYAWSDYMKYISDEITAYREGSNTDAKRD